MIGKFEIENYLIKLGSISFTAGNSDFCLKRRSALSVLDYSLKPQKNNFDNAMHSDRDEGDFTIIHLALRPWDRKILLYMLAYVACAAVYLFVCVGIGRQSTL